MQLFLLLLLSYERPRTSERETCPVHKRRPHSPRRATWDHSPTMTPWGTKHQGHMSMYTIDRRHQTQDSQHL